MWQDLYDLCEFQAGLVVAYTRDSTPNINREILDVCLSFEPARQCLMYTPQTGLQKYDMGVSRFVPFMRDGHVIGQGADRVGELVNFLTQYYHPYVLHLQNFELYAGGPAISVFLQLAEALKGRQQLALASVQPGVKNFPIQYEGKVTYRNMPLPTVTVLEQMAQAFYEQNEGFQLVLDADLFRRFRTEIAGVLSGLVEYEAQIAFKWAFKETQRHYYNNPGALNSVEGVKKLINGIVQYKSGQVLMKHRLIPVDLTKGYHPISGAEGLMNEVRLARDTGMMNPNHPFPLKGYGFVGPTGLGKSDLCKMVCHELGIPLYDVNPSAMMGDPGMVGTVGAMEAGLAAIFDDAEALTSGGRRWIAIRFDEFEKLMGGSQVSNRTDGGAGARQLQQFLTFATERAPKIGVLLLVTMNSTDLPVEALRDGRISMYGVIPPNQQARGKISFNLLSYMVVLVNQWNRQNGMGPVSIDPRITPEMAAAMSENYTGGEIHAVLEKALKYGHFRELTLENLMNAFVNTKSMATKEPEKFKAQVLMAMNYPLVSGNPDDVIAAQQQWQGYMPPGLAPDVMTEMVEEEARQNETSIQKLTPNNGG